MKKILILCLCTLTVLALTPVFKHSEPEFSSVVRFHIRANSDSGDDQNVKLAVRDAVVAYTNTVTENCKNAEEAAWKLSEHFDAVKSIAEHTLRENGFFYGARVSLTNEIFPEKKYGEVVFPKGRYNAVRVDLGDAEGHNFWCVLFPPICLSDACTEDTLDEYGVDDFDTEPKFVIKFKLWECIKSLFARQNNCNRR